MNNYKLRNHIPIAGPATREPYSGDESSLRVSIGFVPKKFHQELCINFGEQWHLDPVYRYNTLVKMKKHLHEEFAMVDYFEPCYDENSVEKSCCTISGVYGIKFIPMIYGLDVQFFEDDWPDNSPGQFLSKEHLAKLKPFDLEKKAVVRQLLKQMDIIEKNYGEIHGYVNYQGILNVALKLRGSEIFMDIYDDPNFVKHLFEHIANTIMSVAKLIQKRQRKSGFYINLISMSNCVMNMVHPDVYKKFVFPLDLMLSENFERFGIHTCNWNITPYIDVLSPIKKMGYIDMGMMSNMQRVKEVFPDARRAVFYSPVELEKKSIQEIQKDIESISLELAPCDIVLADITASTNNNKIIQFLELANNTRTRSQNTLDAL